MSCNPIDTITSLLDCKPSGKNQYKALCPCHNEKTPSLGIKELPDGKVIMHCFGCGASGIDVAHALGLNASDLFPNDKGITRTGTRQADLNTIKNFKAKHDRGQKLDPLEINQFEAAITRVQA